MDSDATIAHCALDRDGLETQGARYSRLAVAVTALQREPRSLTVEFDASVDRELLDQTLAIERECCPFFTLELDEQSRRLRASVSRADQAPALDALAEALAPSDSD
ncbi:MAG: hypothetical protein ACJ760_01890 [Thermoleophilaceae bacterium]